VSIVSDGEVLGPGDTLIKTSAPAGIDEPTPFYLTLTNRSAQTLTLSTDPNDWLQADGFTWTSSLPGTLEPEESALLALDFNPSMATAESIHSAALTIPHTEANLSLNLEAHVPRPLRIVMVGQYGYTLISDNYGASFDQEHFPTDTSGTEVTLGVAWGNDTFVRYSREDGWGSDAIYEYSADGQSWSPATVAAGGWAFDCAYGLGFFLCSRDYGGYLTRSDNGSLFIHERGAGVGTFIQALTFTDSNLIGAGRGGTLALSEEFIGFESYISDSARGSYNDIIYVDGLTVAVGGSSSSGYTISTSANNGLDWSHQRWEGSTYSTLYNIVHEDGLWLIRGSGGELPSMLRSDNGLDWESLADHGMTASYSLLGGLNGWIFGVAGDSIYRTQDGLNWEPVHTFTTSDRPVGFAAEAWNTP